jgi:lipid-A-disaccharide synthase
MKILLLAGEESGMLYARSLKERFASSGHEVRGYSDYGFETADLAVFGFGAVLRKIPFFLRVKRTMERAINEWRPDAICTIDYPGMNLKLAAYAKVRGVRAVHVVCPQVWAWHQDRIPKIEASLDKLCCFFPFEPALFSKPGFAEFVGHPLAREFVLEKSDAVRNASRERKLVAILPGSRSVEISRILPGLLEAADMLHGADVVIPAANQMAMDLISGMVAKHGGSAKVKVQLGGARDLLRMSDCAAVASGTATLEAALARCPTLLVYRVGRLLAAFARRVIKGTKYIGLANIVWQRCGGTGETPPMTELLQEDFTPEAVASRLNAWLTDDAARNEASRRLDETVRKLDTEDDPLSKIAETVTNGCK